MIAHPRHAPPAFRADIPGIFAMPDPRLFAYADLCWAVALAGVVLWFDLIRPPFGPPAP